MRVRPLGKDAASARRGRALLLQAGHEHHHGVWPVDGLGYALNAISGVSGPASKHLPASPRSAEADESPVAGLRGITQERPCPVFETDRAWASLGRGDYCGSTAIPPVAFWLFTPVMENVMVLASF